MPIQPPHSRRTQLGERLVSPGGWIALLLAILAGALACSSAAPVDYTRRGAAALAEIRATSEAVAARVLAAGEETDEEIEARYEEVKAYLEMVKASGALSEPITDQYVIPLHAVKVADDDGRREADITPQQFRIWVDRTNEIFASTGIQFTFSPDPSGPDWTVIHDTALNNLQPASGSMRYAEAEAMKLPPAKLVVFVRNGTGRSPERDAFSAWPRANFVVMSGFSQLTGITGRDANGRWIEQRSDWVLAHELGHALGLLHPFPGASDGLASTRLKAALAVWYGGGDEDALDGDLLSDTPPEAGASFYLLQGWDPCQGHDSYTISETIRGRVYEWTFTPDRQNVMSYFGCEPLHFSPQQARVMHRSLATRGFLPIQ